MFDFLLTLQSFYENHFEANATTWTEAAAFYGWFATASLIVALVTLPFVILRREQARNFAVLVGQHVLIIGIPWFIAPLAALFAQ